MCSNLNNRTIELKRLSSKHIQTKKNKKKKSMGVKFVSPELNKIHQIDIIPNSFLHDIWYSPIEMAGIKIKRKMIAKLIRTKRKLTGENGDDSKMMIELYARGIENAVNPDFNKQRLLLKRTSVSVVIEEQRRQRCSGECSNPETIAAIYSLNGPLQSQLTAHEKGIEDENQCYHNNNKSNEMEDISLDCSDDNHHSGDDHSNSYDDRLYEKIDEALQELDSIDIIDYNILKSFDFFTVSKPTPLSTDNEQPVARFLQKAFVDCWRSNSFASSFYEQWMHRAIAI